MNEIKLWWNLAKYSIKWSVLGLTALDYLKELGPSAVDSEIRCLGPDAGGSVTVMCQFLDMISYVLDTKKDFEISNAYLGLFLKVIIMLIYFPYMNYNSIIFTSWLVLWCFYITSWFSYWNVIIANHWWSCSVYMNTQFSVPVHTSTYDNTLHHGLTWFP